MCAACERRDRARRRDELLQLVALEGYAERLPGQLSGGQQQRVAVARALAHEPQVLLLDEPFGALDAKIRVELRETIRQVQRRLGMTTILVTHDQEEAFALADRIGIMHNGRLLETGRAETLYRRPATRFVATFLGAANLFLGERDQRRAAAGQALSGRRREPARAAGTAATRWSRWCGPRTSRSPRMRSGCAAARSGVGHVLSVDFGGVLERLRVQLRARLRAWCRRSCRTRATRGCGRTLPVIVDVTRTNSRTGAAAARRRQARGARHTPLSSCCRRRSRVSVCSAAMPATAAALRHAPLLRQLVQSMQAPVLEAQDSGERDAAQTGVGGDRLRAPVRSREIVAAARAGAAAAAVHPAARRHCRAAC